jgi:hypothetical protein
VFFRFQQGVDLLGGFQLVNGRITQQLMQGVADLGG